VVLRNVQGREGRVAWNTLRDGESGRIRLTYGDVLSIDATQGVTSTEHIEAMPAGTQAVNAYKAYTAASRHRRATFLVSSDGADRREVAGRRPLGDLRPIGEADVWANMGRNLSRQPKVMSALEFLEKARDVRRAATGALQAGLQPAEQRQAESLLPTTLAETFQKGRLVGCVRQAAEELSGWSRLQAAVLDELARLPGAVHAAVRQTMVALRPALQHAADRIYQRPERVHRRQQEAELAAGRERLVARHMKYWWNETLWGRTISSPAMEAQWAEQAKAEEAKQRAAIAIIPETELRQLLRLEDAEEQRLSRQAEQAARSSGPSPM
jgi:hypothetical protein